MTDRDVEKTESKRELKDRERRLCRSIEREWSKTGYYPTRHLKGISAAGEPIVLQGMLDTSRQGYWYSQPDQKFPAWLASQDLNELLVQLRRVQAPPPAAVSRSDAVFLTEADREYLKWRDGGREERAA